MHHYTYQTSAEDGRFYIGSRSSKRPPSADPYMGSGVWPISAERSGISLKKTILQVFPSRTEACAHESEIIAANWGNPLLMNISRVGGRGRVSVPLNPFEQFMRSPMGSQTPGTKAVWIALLALSDGAIISIPSLMRASGVSELEMTEALSVLMAPCPYSKNDHQGRRISVSDGIVTVLSHPPEFL